MVAVQSTMLPLGSPAPDFALQAADGSSVARDDLRGGALVVAFICNHCPFVRHIAPALATVTAELMDAGAAVVAINANDPEAYPDDDLAHMAVEATERGYRFPYLFDATQEVAKAYRAACTPDLYVFDGERRLVYRGQFDATRPGGEPATGADLRAAVEATLAGRAVADDQAPAVGCNIKWRPGNAPDYFG